MVLADPLYMQAKTYSAQQDRQLLAALTGEGVIDVVAGELKVGVRGAGANMSVDVAAGRAAIVGDDAAGQGSYLVRSTAVENLPIGAAPGSNSRIDLVLARVRDASVTGGVSSDWILYVLPGTASPSPIPAAVPASAILLAQVLVSAGTTAITNGMITDRRAQAVHAAYVSKASVVESTVLAAQTTASTTYGNLATVGPTTTARTGTSALVIVSASLSHSAVGGFALASVEVSGATTLVAADDRALYMSAAAAAQEMGASRVLTITGLTPGDNTFTVKYKAGGAAGTATFLNRRITVIPL